tara:strand:- start:235 stop:636 length:402 start_codon:yes stop_codon:yes gene_type:complete
MYLVYLLKSDNSSYVGMTNDFFRRFRQHNKEIKGGAKYTSKKINWYPVIIIDGFPDKKSACQCEWRVKRGKNGSIGRAKYLSEYIHHNDKWTSKCEKSIIDQNLTFYIDNDYLSYFNQYNVHTYNHKELFWKE